MSENRKPQIAPEVDATGVRKGFAEIKDAARDMATSVEQAGKKGGAGIEAIGDSSEAVAVKAKKSAAETERAYGRLTAEIIRVSAQAKAAAEGTGKAGEILNKAIGQGLDPGRLQPYLDGLRQAEAAQKAAAGSLGTMEMSAKQTAAALRGVPAQFTDIATSIASGQAPLTVFLQQGGQLKDMFGGAGNAARALGGYVAGLINPFTLAAAAVAGLGYAYAKGSAEAQEFQKTLILTGNQAGVTAGQLMDMAAAVRASGAGSQGRAAEVINVIASSGDVAAGSIQRLAQAAIQFERVGGPAAEKTAQAFADLGKSPLQAALKLDEATNFLTRSTYQQIKALEEQGRKIEAATLAQNEYAKSINSASPELLKNLGFIERAWLGIKDATKGAVDAALDVGRQDTAAQAVSAIGEKIAAEERKLEQLRSLGPTKDTNIRIADGERRIEQMREQQRLLQANVREEIRLANSIADGNAKKQATIEADKLLERLGIKRITLAQEEKRIRDALAAGGVDEETINKALEKVRDGFVNKSAVSAANRDLEAQKKLLAELAGLSGTFESDWEALSKLRKADLITVEQLEKAQAKLLAQQPIFKQGAKDQEEAAKAQAKAQAEATKEYERWVDAFEKSAGSVEKNVQQMRDEEQAAIMAASGQMTLAQAIQMVAIARLEEQRNFLQGDEEADAAVKREIAARKELITLIGSKDARDAAAKSAKDAENEWKRASQQIEQSITDGLMRGFESGKGFAENLRDTIENMFKTLVLRPIVQAAVQPIAGSITSALGFGSGTANAINGLSNASSAYRNATGLYGGASAAWQWATGAKAAGAAGSGAAIGGEFAAIEGGAASGSAGALGSLSSSIPIIGAIIAGMFQANSAYKQGYSDQGINYLGAGSQQKVLTKLLTSLGMGSQMANILTGASLTDKLLHWGAGTMHTGASSEFSQAAGLTNGVGLYGVGLGSDPANYSKTLEDGLTSQLVQSVVGILDSTATAFGKTAGFAAAAGFADDTSKDGAWGALAIKLGDQLIGGFGAEGNGKWPGKGFADGQAGLDEYISAVVGSTRDALDAIGLPSWAKEQITALNESLTKDGKTLGLEDLSGVIAQIQVTQAALVGLGKVMPQLAGISGDTASALLKAFGGIEALSQAAGGYYENFYSEAERNAAATASLTDSLGKLGFTLPATREAFRALVEAQDLSTEAGQKAYAELIKLSPSFASLVAQTVTLGETVDNTAEQIAKAAEVMAEAGRRSLSGLADDKDGLLVELLKAQGDTAGAAALARQQALAKLTEGVSDVDKAAILAAYDYNQALRDQIAALLAATSATEQAAATQRQAEADAKAKAEAIASQAYGLTTQILQLEGNTAELRRRELEQLDPANRALQERIYALQDQKSAESAAAQAADAIARAQASAASEAQRAAEEQQRAAEQIRQAWQSVGDSLIDEVKRIRGLITGGSSMSFANAQAQFAITSAQARAGDQEAAKLLPGLSQTLLTLAEAQATSLFELQRIRAQTAASLEGTAGTLSGLFGLTVPKLATGTNHVDQDMLAILHKGEAVVPAAYNPGNGGGQGMDQLIEKVEKLQAVIELQGEKLLKLQGRQTEIVQRWELNGIPETRE